MRRRIAIAAGCLAAALLAAVSADRRLVIEMLSLPAATREASGIALQSRRGPMVAPVRRVMPLLPPLPDELLAAGDVEEPSRAPADAPVPERKDIALAEAARAADAAAAAASVTVTASDDTRAGGPQHSVAE